jgi:hypothetical protein
MATHAMTWNPSHSRRHGRHAASLLVEVLTVLHRMWLALWAGQRPRRRGRHEKPEVRPAWELHPGATAAWVPELREWADLPPKRGTIPATEWQQLVDTGPLDTVPLIFHTPLDEIHGHVLVGNPYDQNGDVT